jgi:hypothetical protein
MTGTLTSWLVETGDSADALLVGFGDLSERAGCSHSSLA